MKSKSVFNVLIISLVILPVALAIALLAGGDGSGSIVTRVLFAMTVLGIARALSFLVLSLMLKWWKVGAQFSEQYCLWIFAVCRLLAALSQQEILPSATKE